MNSNFYNLQYNVISKFCNKISSYNDYLIEEEKIKFKPNPDIYRISPLILVVDLDSTLIYADEERITTSISFALPCYYRTEMYYFFYYLRKYFREKLLLILWSTGTNSYVDQMVTLLNITDFDLILGQNESNESYYRFDARKSPKYLLSINFIRNWITNHMRYNGELPPVFAIIDDKARENTSSSVPYNYTFSPEPMNLKSFQKLEDGSMISKVESLMDFAYILVVDLIFANQPYVDIQPAFNVNYFLDEYRYREYIFKPEPAFEVLRYALN
ncbi:hypothetical protein B4U79_18415 [Dinothrombium tinctorium]|uniref:FCP1 homology domain-containing protein n=1 Tax=Dinothrombium tinctorium TaxID=1965070 RepID=A0A3S3NFQ3_9ACAR|nr:hypothetical protein B4U79_18608 [Dinothrombium tinctorium]RWS01748.1 hypothetical protein B4U79_18538 [Dinothrombium tinctorium]RWS02086.1 hypothetical protein B4U79_18525 [Dinothrombium tinctorium]RWS03636.1 hypothetical protein B4U79_18415 [Dinothrombium tinctorium]